MNPEIKKLQEQLDALQEQFNLLRDTTTIPLEISEAFKARIMQDAGILINSGISATAHNKSVNESGSANYSVMDKPTGFVQVTIAGVTKYIPYF